MAWRHPVATVVIDATAQQDIGFAACDRLIVAVVAELGLHRVEEITIKDGGLLASAMPRPSGRISTGYSAFQIRKSALPSVPTYTSPVAYRTDR